MNNNIVYKPYDTFMDFPFMSWNVVGVVKIYVSVTRQIIIYT